MNIDYKCIPKKTQYRLGIYYWERVNIIGKDIKGKLVRLPGSYLPEIVMHCDWYVESQII